MALRGSLPVPARGELQSRLYGDSRAGGIAGMCVEVLPHEPISKRLIGERKGTMATQSTADASDKSELGPLPEWDLSDLYPGRDSPALKRDLEGAAKDATAFA